MSCPDIGYDDFVFEAFDFGDDELSESAEPAAVNRGRPLLRVLRPCDETNEVTEKLEVCTAEAADFSPMVSFSEDGRHVAIRLPELELFGVGETLEQAEAELVDLVIEYAIDWENELKDFPNHQLRMPWVQAVLADLSQEGVRRILFDR